MIPHSKLELIPSYVTTFLCQRCFGPQKLCAEEVASCLCSVFVFECTRLHTCSWSPAAQWRMSLLFAFFMIFLILGKHEETLQTEQEHDWGGM
jgi:hypothetical protein